MVLGNNESVGEEDDLFDDLVENKNKKADQATWLEDLSWRVNKMKLEEANTRRFLKAPPRFLPYAECRAWVRAWNRWDSERDWYVYMMDDVLLCVTAVVVFEVFGCFERLTSDCKTSQH
jgi:hypothetical protein